MSTIKVSMKGQAECQVKSLGGMDEYVFYYGSVWFKGDVNAYVGLFFKTHGGAVYRVGNNEDEVVLSSKSGFYKMELTQCSKVDIRYSLK